MTPAKVLLFLVDDDAVFLKSLEVDFLLNGDYTVETFSTGELCLQALSRKPDVIILDYHLDGITRGAMTGMQTLDKIKLVNATIPVIMLSSQDKIQVAVNCMHHGATDYVVKNETGFMRILKIISSVFHYNKVEKELKWYMERM